LPELTCFGKPVNPGTVPKTLGNAPLLQIAVKDGLIIQVGTRKFVRDAPNDCFNPFLSLSQNQILLSIIQKIF